MLENAYKSIATCTDRAGVGSVVNAFCFIDHHEGCYNFIRALNLNFQPFSYTRLVQDKFVNL